MQPKKYIKKLNNFKERTGLRILQEPMYRHRYILDLGPYGEYFVDSEIPRISRSNFDYGYFGEMGRNFRLMEINPIRVIIREVIRSGDLNSWVNYQDNIYGRKINATLMSIDPLGSVISQWILIGCSLRDFQIDYEFNEINEFTMVMDNFVSQF